MLPNARRLTLSLHKSQPGQRVWQETFTDEQLNVWKNRVPKIAKMLPHLENLVLQWSLLFYMDEGKFSDVRMSFARRKRGQYGSEIRSHPDQKAWESIQNRFWECTCR